MAAAKRILASLIVLAVMSPAFAAAQSLYQTHPVWFQCKTDDDCTVVCMLCGPGAVNDDYKDALMEALKVYKAKTVEYKSSVACKPDLQAVCRNQQCFVKPQVKTQPVQNQPIQNK